MGVFDRRVSFKPFEYPWAVEFKEKVQSAYWLVDEMSFDSDVDDFKVRLTGVERDAVRRAMLAISQVEAAAVKLFWPKLHDRFPKAEFAQVGIVFGESEVRHADAYSELLTVLGLNEDFDALLQVPAIKGRVDYLSKYLPAGTTPQHHTLSLVLFSLFVENVSLFGQFAVIKSVFKHRALLKNIDNVVQATQMEEQLHALFGIRLVNTIREENPGWFDAGFYGAVYAACRKACEAELAIVDWMYEGGELPYLTRDTLKAFIQDRFNQSLRMIGGEPLFAVDAAALAPMRWFDEELLARINPDFFNKRPVTYSRVGEPITADELF